MMLVATKTLPPYPDNIVHEEDPDEESILRPKQHQLNSTSIPLPQLLYTPPVNFGMVTHNLFRSSFPQKENFAYLRKLRLKSVLYVLPYFSFLE